VFAFVAMPDSRAANHPFDVSHILGMNSGLDHRHLDFGV
jgi:hypothetical protein